MKVMIFLQSAVINNVHWFWNTQCHSELLKGNMTCKTWGSRVKPTNITGLQLTSFHESIITQVMAQTGPLVLHQEIFIGLILISDRQDFSCMKYLKVLIYNVKGVWYVWSSCQGRETSTARMFQIQFFLKSVNGRIVCIKTYGELSHS